MEELVAKYKKKCASVRTDKGKHSQCRKRPIRKKGKDLQVEGNKAMKQIGKKMYPVSKLLYNCILNSMVYVS